MNPQQSTQLCNIKYKIVFLGQMSTGKTSIIQRFSKNRFDQRMQQTVGVDLISKNVCYKTTMYKLQLWDTAGQEKYRCLVPNYIRDAHCAVLVYDITNQKTLQNLIHWYELFKNYQPQGAIAILVGNKCDRKQQRQVQLQRGYEWARKYQMAFAEVSAKSGQFIEDVFHSIVQNIDISTNQSNSSGQLIDSAKYIQTRNQTTQDKVQHQKGQFQTSNQLSQSSRFNKKTILQLNKESKAKILCCHI